ncbi:hypothetical protein PF011_g28342 [Phytophthora fragariae]|uniref:RxLR effector protein n=1 Tax=Phytophthora fragariae TaxID=53985 RepID=A0A6A3H848_9STRA|nr:hypothetical protein PF011_g28342 [Phytophthora fragariae]
MLHNTRGFTVGSSSWNSGIRAVFLLALSAVCVGPPRESASNMYMYPNGKKMRRMRK